MNAKLTVAGMAAWRSATNESIFDLMVLPTPPIDSGAIGLQAGQLRAAWIINKDDLIDFIALHTMGLSLAVPDFDWLRNAIGTWSKAHIHEWQRVFDTLFYKYNPIWNKDGEITESGWDHKSKEDDSEGTATGTNTGTNTDYTHGYDGGTTHADDGLAWTHAEKSKANASNSASMLDHTEGVEQSSYSHTTNEKGNIGVTMTQDMILKERDIAMFSIDEYLAEEFKKQFCLMIW